MKKMNDFRHWLSAVNAESTPLQRRLAALTRLTRTQLDSVAYEPWFFWGAEAAAG